MKEQFAIVGAGLTGAVAASTLRTEGYEGRIFLFGDEACQPYDRPSLSKTVLSGEVDQPPSIFEKGWERAADIEMVLDKRVSGIDARTGEISFATGASIVADRILLATGSSARRMSVPGADLDGVFTLRTWADSIILRQYMHPGTSFVIVGGGLIGCEVATTAVKAGVNVTILESADELLGRVLGREVGAWCRNELQRKGVSVRLNSQVAAIEGSGRVGAVRCEDGQLAAADIVLISIGADPVSQLASAAGLDCDRGVQVTATGMTSSSAIFAAGDVASWPLRSGGSRCLETYTNSQLQAEISARAMLGKGMPQLQVPISWTEIAGRRIQMIGDFNSAGELVTRGNWESGAISLFRVLNGCVVAAVVINAPKDFAIAMRLVESQREVETRQLVDTQFNLRELLKSKTGRNVLCG